MEALVITRREVGAYERYLWDSEHSRATVEKYRRGAEDFLRFLSGGGVTKREVIRYKQELAGRYTAAGVNGALAAVNGLLSFLGRPDLRVRTLKRQRQIFRSEGRELNRPEYQRLVETARGCGRERLMLVMETICATGIRVSELSYITVEAARQGTAEVACKGKRRTVFLSPGRWPRSCWPMPAAAA